MTSPDSRQTMAEPALDIPIDRVVERFGDLPTLAPVAVEVIRLADDPDASVRDIADAISQDAGLTVRLLRLANSAAYSRGNEVTNLNTAAGLVGIHTLKMVTLGFTLVAEMRRDVDGYFDSSLLWRRSLIGSVLARQLAADRHPALAEDAFVAGLLSNIGKVALAEEADYIAALGSEAQWVRSDQERRLLGYNSDEISARILASWDLPSTLIEAIRHRSDPSGNSTEENGDVSQRELSAVLKVADEAAALLLVDNESEQASAVDALTASAASHLGLAISDIEATIGDLTPELDGIAKTFELEGVGAKPVAEIISAAQGQLAKLGVELAVLLSEEQTRNQSLVELNRQLTDAASTDSLTGLPNRRTFDAYLENQVAGRLRKARHTMLGLVIFDLDHFKSINDSFGHSIGDDVLKEFGRRIQQSSRRGELVARIGGEEFALVMPDVESVDEIRGAAERIRTLLGRDPVSTAVGPITVTASVGGTYTGTITTDTGALLFKVADEALYLAKGSGRDRVEVAALD